MKFSQPRSYNILLRCKRQCGITGLGYLHHEITTCTHHQHTHRLTEQYTILWVSPKFQRPGKHDRRTISGTYRILFSLLVTSSGQHAERLHNCKSGKQHKSCSSVLCTMDDANCFLVIRLGPKTSECEKKVTVVSTVTGCEVTNCATTSHGSNKHASSRREAASDLRGVPRCTEKTLQNLRLLTCVDHKFCLQLVFITRFRRASCQENSSH